VESSEGGLCLVHGRGTRMIEFLMQGVALGALYALIAIPLSLVWMTAHSLDLAVGGYAVFGGLAYAAAGGGGIGLLVALVAGAACGAFSASLFLGLRRLGVADPMAPGGFPDIGGASAASMSATHAAPPGNASALGQALLDRYRGSNIGKLVLRVWPDAP
jgi:hypothetical protein